MSLDLPLAPHPAATATELGPVGEHLVLACSGADSVALSAITRHHAEISGALAAHVTRILKRSATGDGRGFMSVRDAFGQWSRNTVTVLLSSEAAVLYPVAEKIPDGSELIHRLRDGLDKIGDLLEQARTETDPVSVAAATVAVRVAVEHPWMPRRSTSYRSLRCPQATRWPVSGPRSRPQSGYLRQALPRCRRRSLFPASAACLIISLFPSWTCGAFRTRFVTRPCSARWTRSASTADCF